MDASPERISQDIPLVIAQSEMEGAFVVDHSSEPAACTLCRRILGPDNEAADDLESVSLCGDCKFLLLEDIATPTRDSHRRRHARGRRNRQSSSESIENLFSQRFSHMINLVRQNQSTVSGAEDPTVDGDATATPLHYTSSRTTPSGSRRWRRVLSDTESDGFDNPDSLYGDSESNISVSRYRLFHGDSDAISFSAYGGDSDASVDGHSFLDTEILIHQDNRSDTDSDTDIDPMHAGLSQWTWDEPEEDDEGDEDGEWEEADAEEETVGFTISRAGTQDLFILSPRERNFRVNPNSFHGRGFEQLLDHLAGADSSRRGAPPASVSFVKNLPRVIVSKEHEKHDGLSCAICKDVLSIGAEVNQLPCLHLYHRSCILPWLSTRNSCPLCRYELPTDDKDYEEGKQHINGRREIHEIQQQDASYDSSSSDTSGSEPNDAHEFDTNMSEPRAVPDVDPMMNSSVRESGRDWLMRAAAPLVGIVGVVLMLWLGKPLIGGRGSARHYDPAVNGQHAIHASGPSPLNRRGNRSRRWFFF